MRQVGQPVDASGCHDFSDPIPVHPRKLNAMLLDDDPVHAFPPYPAAAIPSARDGPLAGLTLAERYFRCGGLPDGLRAAEPHVLARSGTNRLLRSHRPIDHLIAPHLLNG